jgi:predicted DNA-binding transcriptional regulator AlpA
MSIEAKSKPTKLLHTRTEVLAMLGVSVPSLNRWIAAGQFPPPDVMLGTKRAWKVETIERWIDNGGTAGKGGG